MASIAAILDDSNTTVMSADAITLIIYETNVRCFGRLTQHPQRENGHLNTPTRPTWQWQITHKANKAETLCPRSPM